MGTVSNSGLRTCSLPVHHLEVSWQDILEIRQEFHLVHCFLLALPRHAFSVNSFARVEAFPVKGKRQIWWCVNGDGVPLAGLFNLRAPNTSSFQRASSWISQTVWWTSSRCKRPSTVYAVGSNELEPSPL